MAQTLVKFDTPVRDRDGRSYIAMACGRERDNGGQWEAWLEFKDLESGDILRSQRETMTELGLLGRVIGQCPLQMTRK